MAEKRMPDLPGMYFDKEKKKYFKIQPGTPYSSEIVKRRKLHDFKTDEAEALKLSRKPYIKRSHTLKDPLQGGLLRRETSSWHAPGEVIASGLDGPEIIYEDNAPLKSESPIPAFDWDPVTRGLFIPRNGYRMLSGCPESIRETSNATFDSDIPIPQRRRRAPLYNYTNCRSMVFEQTKVSSINVNASARLVCMTRFDTFGPFGIVVAFLNNRVAIPNDQDRLVADGSHIHLNPPSVPRRSNMTVWTSVAAPPSSSLSFAVGMDNNIMTIENERADAKWIECPSSRPAEIMSLDFSHKHPDLLLAGDRQGEINLLDLRIPDANFGRDNISCPSTVTCIKSLDDQHILVAGPGEGVSMFQYDLRWRKKTSNVWIPKRTSCTAPFLEYQHHHNTHLRIGLDVDIEAGLIAAAQEDQTVQLFSLHHGHKIDWVGDKLRYSDRVECLRFVPDREGSMKSLYVGGTDSISRFSW